MKKTFTDEQIVGILRGFEASGVGDQRILPLRRMSANRPFISGVSDSPAMEVEELRHFKQLQQENARLKKLLAERDLEIDVMKEVLAKKW